MGSLHFKKQNFSLNHITAIHSLLQSFGHTILHFNTYIQAQRVKDEAIKSSGCWTKARRLEAHSSNTVAARRKCLQFLLHGSVNFTARVEISQLLFKAIAVMMKGTMKREGGLQPSEKHLPHSWLRCAWIPAICDVRRPADWMKATVLSVMLRSHTGCFYSPASPALLTAFPWNQ